MRAAVLAVVLVSGSFALRAPAAAGQETPAPSGGVARQYQAFVEKLPASNRESILAARDEMLTYLQAPNRCNGDAACAQAVFGLFRNFYDRAIRECDRDFYGNRPAQELLMAMAGNRLERPLAAIEGNRARALTAAAPDKRRVLSDLFAFRDCGIDFTQGEGDWYLRDDPDWLVALAAHLPDGEYKQYVTFIANENRERIAEDAGFLVPRDTLRLKLVRWDAFIRTHPNVARTEKMRETADRIAGWYVAGIDNTPAFDYETGRLNPQLRESFARFLAANQDCSYYPLIAGLWRQLKASGFRPTDGVFAYLEQATAGSEELRRWVGYLRGYVRRAP